jgi:hypothetical protein
MVIVVVVACLLVASSIIILLPHPKRFAQVAITNPKHGDSFVWGEAVRINGTLVLFTNEIYDDLWRTHPNVTLAISAVYPNGTRDEPKNYNCTVENATFRSEPIQWNSPAKITLEAVFLGNETYERSSAKIEFEVGKRKTSLTIDTKKPEYVNGSIRDTYEQGIRNATVIIYSQTDPSVEIDRCQTDQYGKYEIPWNYPRNPSGNYTLRAKFGGNDLYNASDSNPIEVHPSFTMTGFGFEKPTSEGGNATFRVNVTNTGFLRDNITVILSYQRKKADWGYDPVPNITTTAAVRDCDLPPNQEVCLNLEQPIDDLGLGEYLVICTITSSFTNVNYDRGSYNVEI